MPKITNLSVGQEGEWISLMTGEGHLATDLAQPKVDVLIQTCPSRRRFFTLDLFKLHDGIDFACI